MLILDSGKGAKLGINHTKSGGISRVRLYADSQSHISVRLRIRLEKGTVIHQTRHIKEKLALTLR